jgi:cell division protease FtsH
MNERLGFVFYGDDERMSWWGEMGGAREYSEKTQQMIDEEVKKLIDALFEETRSLLEANREKIDALAKALLKYETLDSNDVERIMRGEYLTRPTVSDLLEKEQRRGTTIQPGSTNAEPDIRPEPGFGSGPLPAPG